MIELHEPYTILVKNRKHYDGPGQYVGRPSILGNPYKISANGGLTREEAIRRYDTWFNDQLQSNVQVQELVIQYLSMLHQSRTLTLICWCHPLPCHADIIKQKLLEIINE